MNIKKQKPTLKDVFIESFLCTMWILLSSIVLDTFLEAISSSSTLNVILGVIGVLIILFFSIFMIIRIIKFLKNSDFIS